MRYRELCIASKSCEARGLNKFVKDIVDQNSAKVDAYRAYRDDIESEKERDKANASCASPTKKDARARQRYQKALTKADERQRNAMANLHRKNK